VIAHLAMVAPFLATAALALGSPRIGRSLPPPVSSRFLAAASLATSVATGFVLSIVAFEFVAQQRSVALEAHWSVLTLRHEDPVSAFLGVPAAAVVGVLLALAAIRLARQTLGLIRAGRACRHLVPGHDGVVIVADDRPSAYAVPGWHGRIVVSTAMAGLLSGPELQAVVAHEASHLCHRHHLLRMLADVAAAANPGLRRAAATVRLTTERWADEDAAIEIGDRRVVAQALARASVATGRRPQIAAALAIGDSEVLQRARALLEPPPARRRGSALLVVGALIASMLSLVVVERTTEVSFQHAQSQWNAQRSGGVLLGTSSVR
jgi:hypothetical protein